VKELIKPFMAVPPHAEDPSFYSDWSDVREFTIGDLGVGECAGEVVSLFGIEVVKAEAQAFDAQIALDEGDPEGAEGARLRGDAVGGARARAHRVHRRHPEARRHRRRVEEALLRHRALLRPLREGQRSAAICSTATRALPSA
jgi:hypothetical protein